MTDEEFGHAFDEAVAKRHAKELEHSRVLFGALLKAIPRDQLRWRAMTHHQAGYVCELLGDVPEAAEHYRESSTLWPSSELASLSWFHALWNRGAFLEALREAYRFVESWKSPRYEELFLYPGYGDGFDGEAKELVLDILHAISQRNKL